MPDPMDVIRQFIAGGAMPNMANLSGSTADLESQNTGPQDFSGMQQQAPQQASPQQAAPQQEQPQHMGPGGFAKSILSNFLTMFGDITRKENGLPTSTELADSNFEKGLKITQLQSINALREAQIHQEQIADEMVELPGGITGRRRDLPQLLQAMMQAQTAAEGRKDRLAMFGSSQELKAELGRIQDENADATRKQNALFQQGNLDARRDSNRIAEQMVALRGGTPEGAQLQAERVASGQINLADVPSLQRPGVIKALTDNNNVIVPAKTRSQLADLDKAEGIVGIMESAWKKLGNKPGSSQFFTGLIRQYLGQVQADPDMQMVMSQKGLLGNLARSFGSERGVLTDRDIDRAGALLAAGQTRRDVGEKLFKQLHDFVGVAREAALSNVNKKFNQGGGTSERPKTADEYMKRFQK